MGVRNVFPLGAVDGIVGAVVEVGGILGDHQIALLGDVGVILILGAGGDDHLTVLFRLFGSQVGEVAGHGIGRLARSADKVQGNGGKLSRGAALHKQDLMGVGHLQQPFQIRLGLVENLLVYLTSVAHLHNGHAAAAVIGHFRRCLLKHGQGEHGGTC